MDINKCIILHNKILRLGWLGSGKTIEEFDRTCKTWFEHYGAEAETMRDVLSDDLVAFLEGAYVTPDSHSFFYYVYGLHGPSSLLGLATCLNESWSDDDEDRFVVLYSLHTFGSHPVGLVFDQCESSAIMCETIMECDVICNGRTQWYYLDTILEAWLDMVEKGKIIAAVEDGDEKFPWSLVPYSQCILQETIETFNQLVDEIETRMPEPDTSNEVAMPMIDEAGSEKITSSQSFAYEFGRKAKRPNFQFIAPGLEVLTTLSAMEQPFASLLEDSSQTSDGHLPSEHIETIPLLLFRAIKDNTPCIAPTATGDSPFNWPCSLVKDYPAGLYLSCTSPTYHNAYEDECMLVLPYRIGANGYAKTSDNALFGENKSDEDEHVEAQDTLADVYQSGYNPFVVGHSVQLLNVLKSWIEMFQEGDWEVDANGVMGGIEEWKKVDTEDEWEKYVLPVTW